LLLSNAIKQSVPDQTYLLIITNQKSTHIHLYRYAYLIHWFIQFSLSHHHLSRGSKIVVTHRLFSTFHLHDISKSSTNVFEFSVNLNATLKILFGYLRILFEKGSFAYNQRFIWNKISFSIIFFFFQDIEIEMLFLIDTFKLPYYKLKYL